MPRPKKTSNLRRWWFGSAFPPALATLHPLTWRLPTKQSTCGVAGLLRCHIQKNNQHAALAVCLRVPSSIGVVASFNTASPENNNQIAALLASLQMPHQKNQSAVLLIWQRRWRW